jgi:metal-responsive CopG/Arc/MetJ family transcriptional regulator
MKKKISVNLSSDLLAKVNELAGSKQRRSLFIEGVLQIYFRERDRRKLHARNLKRINRAAARLNAEADEVLSYRAYRHS